MSALLGRRSSDQQPDRDGTCPEMAVVGPTAPRPTQVAALLDRKSQQHRRVWVLVEAFADLSRESAALGVSGLDSFAGNVRAAAAPAPRRLVAGHQDQTARVWDLEARTEQHTLTRHTGAVSGSRAIGAPGPAGE